MSVASPPGKVSPLSKILYVELLNEQGESLHRTKVSLSDGRGSGKYFIPSLTKTGVYHLVAYTRWMRNWVEYFQTSLHITNPYEELEESSGETGLSVQFFPRGGHLVAGLENGLGILVQDGKLSTSLRGRLVAQQADVSIPFETNEDGWVSLEFAMEPSTSYQLILEGSSGLSFHDLPSACLDCAILDCKVEEPYHVFRKLSGGDFQYDQLALQIQSSQEVISRQTWAHNDPIRIPSTSLPEGMLLALLVDGKDTISHRLIWNGALPGEQSSKHLSEPPGPSRAKHPRI